jgi:hypothetical protein
MYFDKSQHISHEETTPVSRQWGRTLKPTLVKRSNKAAFDPTADFGSATLCEKQSKVNYITDKTFDIIYDGKVGCYQ